MSNPLDFTRRETVLLVDDSPDVLRTIAGLQAEVARRTREALRAQSQSTVSAAVARKLEQVLCALEERAGSDPTVALALTEIRQALQAGATPSDRRAGQ